MTTAQRGLKPDDAGRVREPNAAGSPTPPAADVRAAGAHAGTTPMLRFEAVGVTDIGRQRKHNEDHVLLRPELELFVVADGMGGHNAGDIASKLATVSIRNFFEATVEAPLPEGALNEGYDALTEDAKRLAAAIRKANRDVFEISSTYRQHHGMGSTVVAASLGRGRDMMHVGHVGDSRCYRFREGKLAQLTHDHSLVNDALALKPDLTPEELSRLPKNIITRALGMREEVKVDIRSEFVQAGDVFLLCSDGLSGLVSDEDMAFVLSDATELREAAEQLVSMANDNGGNDNITALLVRIHADEGDDDAPVVEAGPAEDLDEDLDEDALDRARAAGASDVVPGDDAMGEPAPEAERCPACQTPVVSGNVFCVECGSRVDV